MRYYGKAGQWGKQEAHRLFDKRLFLVMLVIFSAGAILGAAVGVLALPFAFRFVPFTREVPVGTWIGLMFTLEAAALVVTAVLFRAIRDPVDRLTIQRIRHIHGAETEALVAHTLGRLGNEWHLFNGVAMKGGGDLDHVLIGPGGVYCISTKGYRGVLSLDSDRWTVRHNGDVTDIVAEAQRLAMKLRHWFEAKLQTVPTVQTVPYVRAVLVAPHLHRDFQPMAIKNVWVFDDVEFFHFLLDTKDTVKPAVITGCVNVLKELTGWDERLEPNRHDAGAVQPQSK